MKPGTTNSTWRACILKTNSPGLHHHQDITIPDRKNAILSQEQLHLSLTTITSSQSVLERNATLPHEQNIMNSQRLAPDVKNPHISLPHPAPQHIRTPKSSSITDSTRQLAHHKKLQASTPQHISHHQINRPTNHHHHHHHHPSPPSPNLNHVHLPHRQIRMRPPHERRMGLLPPRQSQLQIRAFERGCGSQQALRRRQRKI
jgi:hypothetical protein